MNKQQLLNSLKQRGFSKEILNAFSKVKRENFIPQELKQSAYEDTALPIGEGQTISQPYTIAMMLSLLELKPKQKVLEAGSGCGYVLALISEITKSKVYGIEIIKELADKSKQNLKDYKNIKVYHGSGAFPEKASAVSTNLIGGVDKENLGSLYFDRILISAACKEIPKQLLSQLKDNGILVAPVGEYEQSLVAVKRVKNKFIIKKEIPGFVFVPFVEV
ncbi:protein-L-isoaspartate O-methyltransferase [Candidatus Pacearchaeota archaeon]|nr:protein-L-isoaspartate O-methyltransferase [Candidatus Pacearchaeota archaeon]